MKKNILYVSPHYGNHGAERSLVALMEEAKKADFRPIVLIPCEGEIIGLLEQKGLEYIVEPFYTWINTDKGARFFHGNIKHFLNIFHQYKIKKMLTKRKILPDLVHSNSIVTEIGLMLAQKFHIPHIWHIREFGKLDFNMDFELGDKRTKKYFAKSSQFIANSDAVRDYYCRYIDTDKIVTVHNGIEVRNMAEPKWDSPVFHIVMTGRLSQEKGHMNVLEAIKRLVAKEQDNVQVHMYGEGVDREKISARIREENLDRYVKLCGYSNEIDYSQYQMGLMCSKCEAFGRVTVEYMMAGLPVVGSKSGGTVEIIEDGVTGYLYPVDDTEKLSDCIVKLMKNRELCKEFGLQGRKRAVECFSEEAYAKGILKLYNQLL